MPAKRKTAHHPLQPMQFLAARQLVGHLGKNARSALAHSGGGFDFDFVDDSRASIRPRNCITKSESRCTPIFRMALIFWVLMVFTAFQFGGDFRNGHAGGEHAHHFRLARGQFLLAGGAALQFDLVDDLGHRREKNLRACIAQSSARDRCSASRLLTMQWMPRSSKARIADS